MVIRILMDWLLCIDTEKRELLNFSRFLVNSITEILMFVTIIRGIFIDITAMNILGIA
jgi:hypothetical protein